MALGPVAVGDILEVKIACYCRDQLALNLVHCRMTVIPGAAPTYPKLAEGAESIWAVSVKAAINSEADFLGVTIRSVYPAPLGQEYISTLLAGTGGGAGDVLPLQVTGIVTKRTLAPGRKYRGRMYVPFPGEGDSAVTGKPNAGYLTKIDALSSILKSAATATAWGAGVTGEWIVYRRTTPLDSRAISGTTNQPKFATQRRRGSYGRPNARPF